VGMAIEAAHGSRCRAWGIPDRALREPDFSRLGGLMARLDGQGALKTLAYRDLLLRRRSVKLVNR
jgi:hypothetical protein